MKSHYRRIALGAACGALLLALAFAVRGGNAPEIGVSQTNGAAAGRVTPPLHGWDANRALWRSATALVLVVGGLVAVNWFLKRGLAARGGGARGRRLRIVERVPIDQRKNLLLVSLGSREFLLGVGPDRISMLAEIGGERPAVAAGEPDAADGDRRL